MKKVTLIGKENEKYFAPYLAGFKDADNILRLGLINDEKAVAAMVLGVDEDLFILHHICVDENERRKGNARALLRDFLGHADDGRFSGVAAYYQMDEAVDALLSGEGFLVVPGNELCIMDSNAVLSSKNVRALRESTDSLKQLRPLSKLTGAEEVLLEELLEKENVIPDVLDTIPYDPELSVVVLDNASAKAALLMERDNDYLMIGFMCTGSSSGTKMLRQLLTYLTKLIMKDVSINRICFFAQNDDIIKFARSLVGDESKIKRQRLSTNASLMFPSVIEGILEEISEDIPVEIPEETSEEALEDTPKE